MSACVLKSNPDYQKLLNNSNFTESTLNFIVNTYWKEHPEAAVEGKEKYPSLEYVNSFYDTATSVAEIPATVRLWRLNARDTYDFSSLEEAMNKKQELAQTFDDEAILVWETKDDKYHVKVARPLLEDKDRDFSFNREQKNAIAKIADWFMDRNEGKVNDNWVVLEGEAGTGKTSIINDILLNTVNMYGGNVITGAVSNQATDNIIDKLSEQVQKVFNVTRKTVAGMLGLKMDTSVEKKGFVDDPWSNKELFNANIAIIDEASMVTEQLTDYVKEAAKRGIPVLFIGDAAQINPIREGVYFDNHPEIKKDSQSPVFNKENQTLVLSLKERVRQGEDSPILGFAHDYRESWQNGTPIPNVTGKQSSADGRLVYTAKPAPQLLENLIPVFREAIAQNNPNLIHIVPFHRDYKKDSSGNITGVQPRSALWWNQRIYDALHPETAGTYIFQKGDLVRFDDDFALSETDRIHNSTNGQVVSVSDEITDVNGVKFRRVTINTEEFGEVTVPVIAQDIQNQKVWETIKKKLFGEARKMAPGRERAAKYRSIHEYIDGYANVTFSYALNVHRAQGSTYDITVLDQDDIDSVKGFYNPKQLASLGYTAATRAKNVLVVASSNASDKDMKVDLLATNKLFNEARSKKPISVKKEDSTPISAALNSGAVMPSQNNKVIDVIFKNPNPEISMLSNFAEREFSPGLPERDYNTGNTVSYNYHKASVIFTGGRRFKTVEGAFQAAKLAYADGYIDADGDLTPQGEIALGILQNTTSGNVARQTGRAIKNLNTAAWDKDSSDIMYNLLFESFLQNDNARRALVNTGTKKLIHSIPDTGKSDFIGNLTKIRDKFVYEDRGVIDINQDTPFGRVVFQTMKTVEQGNLALTTPNEGTLPSAEPTSLTEVLTQIANGTLDTNASREQRTLAAALVPLAVRLDAKIKFDDFKSAFSAQTHSSTPSEGNNIDVNTNSPAVSTIPARVILHEVTHLFTSTIFNSDPIFRNGIDELRKYVVGYIQKAVANNELKTKEYVRFNDKKSRYTKHTLNFDTYGLSTAKEFFAEAIGNPNFQEVLKQIPAPKKKELSVWDRIIEYVTEAFSRLFKKAYKVNDTVYDQLQSVITYTMEAGSNNIDLSNGSLKTNNRNLTDAQLQEAAGILQLRSPEAFAGVAESQQTIESERTILSNEELKYWNEKGVGEMPRILVGSEHSDPAFHTKQILDIINGKSTVLDRRTGKQITGNDFAGLYLITKHDGLPMLELLQTKIPKLIHFSITTLGGTEYEPGVMKYNDLLDKIEDYIKQGLDPESVTIRIDPIVPGVTKFTDIEEVVRRASTMGIKRIRFSVMDAYPDTVSGLSHLGYDFEKYYGSDPTGLSKSGYKFTAKRQYMENIFDFMLSLKDKYGVTLGTCAEVFGREGINKEGCLSVSAVNNMLGTSIPDLGIANNQQRALCSCYGGKVDALAYNNNCASHCVYCYAKHENDKVLEYYDENGKLKDNVFTRTRREQQIINAQEIDVPGNMPQQKVSYVLSDAELSQRDARKFNSAHFFTPLAEAGDSAVIDVLKEDVEKGNLQIGARLLISDGSTVDEIISATRILRKALSAHIYEGSAIPTDASKYSKEELEALNRAGIRNDGENVFIPSFSVGLSERQLSDIDKRERVNNYKLLTPSEIRAIGLKSMWKVSDIVSKLQTNGVNASREFLSSIDTLKDKDFTGYSRLQIINEVGIGRLLDIARDILFAPQGSDTPRESAKKQFIKENYSVIYEQAQDYLSLNEEITLTKNSVEKTATTQEVGGTLAELLNTDSEMEVAELLGSAAEHWMVGFRQVSAISSLSAMVRRNLSSLLDLDADGNAIADNYGPKLLDVHQAVVDMLHWVSGAKNSDDMLDRLERQMPANPWLRQLVGTYHEDGDPTKPERQGILIRPENGQLKTRFFTNFSKYFQPYIVMYKDNENNTMLREINTKQFSDSTLNDLMLADEHKDLGYLSIWKPEGSLSDDFDELSRIIGQKAANGFPATGMQSPREEVSNEDLRNLQKALTLLNIQSPSIDELSIAIKDVKSYNEIAQILWFIRRSIKERADAYKTNPKNGFTLFGRDNSIKNNLSAILKKLEPVLHTNLEAVSYEAGKMHYGYVQPSYLNMHINDLKGNVDNYQEFLNTNFKNYDGWFYTSGNNAGLAGSGWLNEWLEMLEQRQQYRDMLQHVASLAFEGTGYTDKISPQMGASLLFAYFYDTNKTSAYYRVMLLSNKPSEEYIRFVRFTRGYDTHIIENLIKRTLPAEINRIRTVRERRQMVADGKLSKDNLVASLETGDVNGEKFYFLKFLNDHIANNTALGRAVEDMIDGTLSADPRDARYVEFIRLFDKGFREFMESRFNEFLDNLEADGTITRESGNIVSVYGVQDKVGTRTAARNNLMEFFWNDWYAQLNMQQILFGDPAQYVNAEDLQKRAAQFHSPGMRPDIAALDIKSNRPVSDGFERFVVLDDIVKPSSASVVLEQVHAKILSDPRFTNPDGTLTALGKEKSAMLERIRNLFKDDNVTDGQAVISPTGLRKIMHLFGKWDAHMDEVYDKITSGEDFTNADLDVIWPVIKPFSYSVIAKNTYSSRMPFFSLGVQQKNSMFPIVLAGALARSVGVDNWLTALYDVMENSSREGGNAKNDGIDAVLFASNLKTGLYGSTDISKMSPEQVRNTLNARIQPVNGQTDINGNQRKYNNDYVYEIPFGDWSQQQEVPNHFEGSQQKGSQQRVLTVADTPNTSRDAEGNIKDNFIIVKLLDGTLQKMTVREAKALYFKAHADNINRSAERLAKELALDTKNRKLRNIALSNALVEELKKDGRYGVDMIRAVSVDRFGEFVTPLSDPMLAGVIQQMLNSLIKNRIYKQQIAGGPLVQVSSFGLSKDLNIVYGKETGRPLYAEVMISAPNEWYEKDANGEYIYKEFFDENEELSVERINAVNPKILEMIGYRIPTEAKYSMLPMKIVGFLPRSTESIMLPKEITVLSGSDFDVDKLYIMRRVFQRIVDRKTGNVTYTTDVRDTDERNNNIILDIDWAFLTSELNTDQTISAGQFDDLKRVGYSIAAADNQDPSIKDITKFVNSLAGKGPKQLKKDAYSPSDLMFADTQIKFFKQNMVAAKLIGVFAQANVSHAFVSLLYDKTFVPTVKIDDSIRLKLLDRNGSEHNLVGDVAIDNEWDWSGLKRISAILAECIGASVDAVKDPVFNLMNINMATVNAFSTMIRFGWDTDSMAWFLTTPIIKELVKRYDRLNADGSASIEQVISQLQTEIADQRPMIFDENHAWSKDDFIKMHRQDVVSTKREEESDDEFIRRKYETAHRNWQLLEVFRRMQAMADMTRSIVHITRSNSISAAPGPFAANTFVDDLKTAKFINMKALDGVKGILNNPVIASFMNTTSSLVRNILGDNLVQAGELAYKIYDGVEKMFGYINDDLAQKMSEFMASYLTQWVNPVFDISYNNRKLMLLGFPNIFEKAKLAYPDNKLLKGISLKYTEDNHTPYLELNTRGLEEGDISDLKAAWSTLYKAEEKRLAGSDPFDYQNGNLALKLVEYNYFRGGFGFDSKTFTRIVPEDVKDHLGNYRANTRALTGIDSDSIDIDNLIYQFMLNYGETNMPLQEDLNIQKREDGTLYIPEQDGNARGFANKGIVGVKQGKAGIKYYLVNFDVDAGEFLMYPVSKLGGKSRGFEIEPRTDVRNMKSVFETTIQNQKGSQQTPEDSKGGLMDFVNNGSETPTTTKILLDKMLGRNWMSQYSTDGRTDVVSAFKAMTDVFFDTWQSQAVDKITDKDNFVLEVLNKVKFNLPASEVEGLVQRAIERLNEENICH